MPTRPRQGSVEHRFEVLVPAPAPKARPKPKPAPYRTGKWRRDENFSSSTGVRLIMRREPGITKGDVLQVPFRFQVPILNDLTRPHQFDWATFDTIRLGQKSRPQGRQLMVVQVDTMFLDQPAADATTGTVIWDGEANPQRMLDELQWIMGYTPGSQPEIFRLVIAQPAVWGSHSIVNLLAVLTSLEPIEKAGEVGTEYVNITFEEFSANETLDSNAGKQRPQGHGSSRHKVTPGETLYEIAKTSPFHRPSAWQEIAKANGIQGVSPNSASELAEWMRKHHKTELVIPATGAG